MSEFYYRLAFDIGIASVGWAVMKVDYMGKIIDIENCGVRIFEPAQNSD